MTRRALAPAKVNLCLFLGGPREDGRHELVTVFESVSLADELELTSAGDADTVSCPGVREPNLVSSALRELRAQGWSAPPVRIEISKRIPVAAGMGGGSADAAAALRLAAHLEHVPNEVLGQIARSLGADVPSQLVPGVALGTGAGELLEPLEALQPHAFLIVPLGSHLATARVYTEADRLGLPRTADELAALERELRAALAADQPIPPELLVNDLAPAAVSLRPEIENVLEVVRETGADRPLLCGSGPTVLGIYCGNRAEERAGAGAAELGERFPGTVAAVPVDRQFGAPDEHPLRRAQSEAN